LNVPEYGRDFGGNPDSLFRDAEQVIRLFPRDFLFRYCCRTGFKGRNTLFPEQMMIFWNNPYESGNPAGMFPVVYMKRYWRDGRKMGVCPVL
jgi:hypothetical protein